MIETLIILITLIISFFLLYLINGSVSLRYINGINYIFYRQILISALIGSYIISLSLEYDRWYALDWSSSVRLYGLIAVCYSSLAILSSYLLYKKIFLSRECHRKTLLNVHFSESKFNISITQNFLFFLSSFGFFYILFHSPSWPMLEAIKGNSYDALSGRISFRNDFTGSDFIKNLVAFSASSLYFYISLSRVLIKNSGRLHLIISFLLVILIYTYNSQKGAIFNVLIGALIIVCIVRGKVSRKFFISMIILAITSIVLMFSLVKGIPITTLISSGYKLIIGRLFLGNIEGLFNSFVLFPQEITQSTSFVGIPSVIQKAIFGEVQEPSKLLLMKYFDLSGVQNGTSGFITSYFMAEAWANYSFLGLVLAPLFVSANLFIVDFVLYRYGKNIATVTFYAVMYLQFQLHGEFVGFLYFKYFMYFLVSIFPILSLYIILKCSNVIKKG